MAMCRGGVARIVFIIGVVLGFVGTGSADVARESIDDAGTRRHYLISVPPNYSPERRYPLILVFHGGGGNPAQVLKSSDIVERADRETWILVAPAGSGRFENRFLTWNVGFGFGYAMENHIDDIAFVRRLVDFLKTSYRVDPDRVYATGISNGGMLCHLVAGRLSDRIAAIAPIAATAGGRAEGQMQWIGPAAPQYPVSVIAFNGALDKRVPLQGGRQKKAAGHEPVEMWSMPQTVDFWARHNRSSRIPAVETDEEKQYQRFSYGGGAGGSEVVQYVLFNQGHAWPGGKKGSWLADRPSSLVSANGLMFEFFKRHPRGGAAGVTR